MISRSITALVTSIMLGSSCTSAFTSTAALNACSSLAGTYMDTVHFPNSTIYGDVNQDYWSTSSVLGPACIFTPSTAEEVSHAVKTFKQFDATFAVKGNGGMPIDGFANINSSGVLLSLENMKALLISNDQSVVTIGPGNDWDAVYGFLQPYNLTTIGARLGLVGVSGHLLGGGMTYLSNEHGFSSTSVVEYECVLANGSIITATQTSHPTLYWSLKSGGNSFALVTAFRMLTYATGPVHAGLATYDAPQRTAWITALYNQALYGDADTAGGVEATATWNPATTPDLSYTTYMLYNGDDADPAVLRNWTGALLVPTNTRPLNRTTVFDFSRSLYGGVPTNLGMRTRFVVFSISARSEEAVAIVHDGFFAAARAELAGIAGVGAGLVALPVGRRFVEASAANGGGSTGLDAEGAPYIWFIQTYTWRDAEDDGMINEFSRKWVGEIGGKLEERGWKERFLYLNDADRWQNVFASYGEENLQKLKDVRAEYDPEMVFTRLMPGGWKVADA